MADDTVEALERALERVRAAAVGGDLAALAGMAEELSGRLAALGPVRDPVVLARIQRLARRNEACLDAAMRGLRAARRRLADIGSAGSGLQTYDGTGTTRRLGAPDGALVRRV